MDANLRESKRRKTLTADGHGFYEDEVGGGIAAKRRKKHKEDEGKYSRKDAKAQS